MQLKQRKRLAALLSAAALVMVQFPVSAAEQEGVQVQVNGQTVLTDAYINRDWRTMVPASTAQSMGIDYQVDGESVTFTCGGVSRTYTVGVPLNDTTPAMVDGTIYVPLYCLAQDFGYQVIWDGEALLADVRPAEYPMIAVDTENRALYAGEETETQAEYGWYTWTFEIDPEMDTVGTVGDGLGLLRFRLYVPENVQTGEEYPLVATLGGLGGTNSFLNNSYAVRGDDFASPMAQAENPCYVLNITVPYEACVNYEAELAYIYQFGEIIKAISAGYGNVDMDRIYATGGSQGAGWSYELAAVQPDLLAAILINAGTTVHTTWGDQCDMQAIAGSDINVYIWHGYEDPYIPVNEAYRAYNTLTALGKTNLILEVAQGGHVKGDMYSDQEMTSYMEWLFAQVKGVPCTQEPVLQESGGYADYDWAGVQVLSQVDGWSTAYDYAGWTEPEENSVWDQVKDESQPLLDGEGGTGKTWLSKVRIGDETATSYDDATTEEPVVTIQAGDTVAVTVQGYTGGYGDNWEAFNQEWSVDWAVLEGSVTDIQLTCQASDEPILRPATVTLANGGGPNVNNSLYNENTLDGQQVYVKIDTAQEFQGDTLKVALRFVRDLGNGEYASYWHVIEYKVA